MAENDNSDEIISLEKLVSVEPEGSRSGSVAGAPVPQPKSAASTAPSAPPPAGATAAPPAESEVDQLLAIEDPTFAESLRELSDLKSDGQEVGIDSDLENLVKREKLEAASKGPKRILLLLFVKPIRRVKEWSTAFVAWAARLKTTAVPALKEGSKKALAASKTGATVAIKWLKAVIGKFTELPWTSKLLLLSVILLAGAAAFVAQITFKSKLLPSFQTYYLDSFATVADEEFVIEEKATWANFNDPFLHPEHIVLIDRIIANLKPDSPGPNPMTMLELFIETSSEEAAIELRDRDSEARDVIGRTLNQMPYDELTSITGKNKLKVFLRKDLNGFMTKGRIRRVFFKSIILKP